MRDVTIDVGDGAGVVDVLLVVDLQVYREGRPQGKVRL